MNIFDYALSLKREKELFYRELSRTAGSQGVRELFELLAEEEAVHGRAIAEMAKNILPQLPESTMLSEAGAVIKGMEERQEQPGFHNEQLQLYDRALKYEEQAKELFLHKAAEVQDSCQREMLRRISDAESTHKMVIETIINFVSKPERWLENAEWYHLEEY